MGMLAVIGVIAVVAPIAYAVFVSRRSTPPSRGSGSHAGGAFDDRGSSPSPRLNAATLQEAWQSIEGEFLTLRLSERISLTLKGRVDAAREVEGYLAASRGKHFVDRASGLAILMAQLNVEVPEIEEYRIAIISKLKRVALTAVSKNRDIVELQTNDPELLQDLLEEREEEAYEEFDGRPSQWRSLDELRTPRPDTLECEDALLAKVNHDPKLLWVYSGYANDKAKPRRVPDAESIESWVKLVETGLAVRGADIPAENLVAAFTLAELNDTLKLERPIRRKAAAASQLTPDVIERLPGIRRTFLLKPMDEVALRAIQAFEWVRTQAALLLETVASAERSQIANLAAPAGTRGAHWSIYGECCAKARRLQDRDSSSDRRPSELPPYHIGCEACAEVWVE